MKNFTFDKFINHPSNQAAYELCERLSRLDRTLANLIVLLGESGAGKTHLLWAIVNQYRAAHFPAGVALISPSSFPDVVKKLASHPEKLTSSSPVVVLVDDLHDFDSVAAGELEKVLFALHEHGHTAILATRKHPLLISALSGKCKALLSRGIIVAMAPLPEKTKIESENSCVLSLPANNVAGEVISMPPRGYFTPEDSAQLRTIADMFKEELVNFRDVWEEYGKHVRTSADRAVYVAYNGKFFALTEKMYALADELLLLSREEASPESPNPAETITTDSAPQISEIVTEGETNNSIEEC